MSAPSDLVALATAKSWLGVASSADDALLGALITASSRSIYAFLSRPSVLPTAYSEWYDGRGNYSLILRRYPVVSVSALAINGVAIPAAPSPFQVGLYRPAGYSIRPAPPEPPGELGVLTLDGYVFWRGQNNVGVTYVAGYQVSGEAIAVPLTPYQVTAQAPYGPWASDMGVTYANGTALAPTSATTPSAGQYRVNNGVYTFAAADVGAAVLLSYGYVPQPLSTACMELVAERYRYKDRIGQRTKSIGGQETVSFDLGNAASGMSSYVQMALLQPYKMVAPVA